MRVVDANVLLYAVNQHDERHERCRSWLHDAVNGTERVAFAWLAITAFLRISTHRSFSDRPLPLDEALGVVRAWLDGSASVVVEPGANHLDVVGGLLGPTGTGGNLVSDAHLAAIALHHHAVVVTFDNDFDRFPGVRWHRPGDELPTR